jgi:hypothetical protein
MSNTVLTDKMLVGELAAYIRKAQMSDIVETPAGAWEMTAYQYANAVKPVWTPAAISIEEYRRQTAPQLKTKGTPWYLREPKRFVRPLLLAQAVAKWCIRHSEAIVCTAIGVCVVILIITMAALMTAEWLG